VAEQVQEMLSGGYGYRRLGSWSGRGAQDLEVGVRHRFLNTRDWQLAWTAGLRLPTGRADDPDNLADWPMGSGHYHLFGHLACDFTGTDILTLNVTPSYDMALSGSEVMRVYRDADQPITADRERVRRDPGDWFGLDVTLTCRFTEALSSFAAWEWGKGFRDRISGRSGLDYSPLESGSDSSSQIARLGLSFSLAPLFGRGGFPLPMDLSIEYRDRFAGRNALRSRYLAFGVDCFF
jgi:hypothetical protein